MMEKTDIPYYHDYLSPALLEHLKKESLPVEGVPGLRQLGPSGGLENRESFRFLCELYQILKEPLNRVLEQRKIDRKFLDERTKSCYELNQSLKIDLRDQDYESVLGHEDGEGRIVIGPKNPFYCKKGYGDPIANLPTFLKGTHVTLFGPPDDPKLSINAMNAFHRRIRDEPTIVSGILETCEDAPFWGADDEDSKTPLRQDLISAGQNLKGCFEGTLRFQDEKTGKSYQLESTRLSLPIKRFPGLALPAPFLLFEGNPLPLHLYDFALHLYTHWNREPALCYYVPKLENEEEAAYIRLMIETAEDLLRKEHPTYEPGSIRLFVVLENPRAIFRVNEIMDALHPYFAGASLGWHDYLASTARLFKNDANYRIPVKADPDIVIKYIKASHDLLSEVVGSRGGIKIGGMYGVLPIENELTSPSFQLTIKGYIKDVVTQLKRNLSGFWVAHPDFVRLGMALVQAWKLRDSSPQLLDELVCSLLLPEHHEEILSFIQGSDIEGLRIDDPLYPRSLIVADLKESTFIANHDQEEVRYNVFQSLQYLTDWLSGNGCVALPAQLKGVPVRVMDDLATAERSRWEVWHEIHHGRVKIEDFVRIAHEEMRFIRKDLSDGKKIVQVKWDERTAKWYPIALKLMLKLMTDPEPVEFASELLLPFTIESVRNSPEPLETLMGLEPGKYNLSPRIERLNHYFSVCGSMKFALPLSNLLSPDLELAERIVMEFTKNDILDAASFHGDIGENKRTLDELAASEQAGVLLGQEELRRELLAGGQEYLKRFGMKFLVSAQGKSGSEILTKLNERLHNTEEVELQNARLELWRISAKRLVPLGSASLLERIEALRIKHEVTGVQISISAGERVFQDICLGHAFKGGPRVEPETRFELASLSKTLASALSLEIFRSKAISLETPVNPLLKKFRSPYQIRSLDISHPAWGDQVRILNLMKHNALNQHYVRGFPAEKPMPGVLSILRDPSRYGYEETGALFQPGSGFKYSGGGFLVLEHLLESLEGKPIAAIAAPFFQSLGLPELSFQSLDQEGFVYAKGYRKNGDEIPGGRLNFPACAAGGLGTARSYHRFLDILESGFHRYQGDVAVSHETAVRMLEDTDSSSQEFMGVNAGIGVFIGEALENRFAIHQGANDGFRCLSLHCFRGPDRGKGMVILCNADDNGVLFCAEAAQEILKELKIKGVDESEFQANLDSAGMPIEEIVNLGYKNLVFKAFLPDLPEEIHPKGPLDPLSKYNLLADARIISVSNQRFARAENLISLHEPVFDPGLYGRQGKVMDSWESARHNPKDSDRLILELKKPSYVHYLRISTRYHLGNQAPLVEILGKKAGGDAWITLLPKTSMEGHSEKRIISANSSLLISAIKVKMSPDGGLTRLALFDDLLPAEEKRFYREVNTAECVRDPMPIPQPQKPLAPDYHLDQAKLARNWGRISECLPIDLACEAFGAKIISASNEHYGPAARMISPFAPIHMFDGLESARSRTPGHTESVHLRLAKPGRITRVEMDFTFFRNNNPREVELHGLSQGVWKQIMPKTLVKPYAGNRFVREMDLKDVLTEVKLTVHPDGGMNRLHLYGIPEDQDHA
ncbi:MAG: serine hydrolase [Bdellovibrionales bacterium]|nr:serine hydrolase [Bdellovibrionales bacterium]